VGRSERAKRHVVGEGAGTNQGKIVASAVQESSRLVRLEALVWVLNADGSKLNPRARKPLDRSMSRALTARTGSR
jgi:hypothetical protein